MRTILTNNSGQQEVDPYNTRGHYEIWLKSITKDGGIDYYTCKNISREGSECITKYILDLYYGRNLARGTRKGRRSYNHLVNTRTRLQKIVNYRGLKPAAFRRRRAAFVEAFAYDFPSASSDSLRRISLRFRR